jgi:starvation-inducible DNA-binding protein
MKNTSVKRHVLTPKHKDQAAPLLQAALVDLIDFALQAKQAHWNLIGPNFRAVHLQLDEIIDQVRMASDEVAERLVTIGIAADGRVATVAESSALDAFPEGEVSVQQAIALIADRMATVSKGMRERIEALGDIDPVSEDLLIGITAPIEKQLWMLQSQEG